MPASRPGGWRPVAISLDAADTRHRLRRRLVDAAPGAQFPDHFVIGIDQSADRLARNTLWPGSASQFHADTRRSGRLLAPAAGRGHPPARHYLLYPNPWPKSAHLGRRWHGHPVFPTIVALGGTLECRSNWRIYVEEMAAALSQLAPAATADMVFRNM